jgi:hypothetical protein
VQQKSAATASTIIGLIRPLQASGLRQRLLSTAVPLDGKEELSPVQLHRSRGSSWRTSPRSATLLRAAMAATQLTTASPGHHDRGQVYCHPDREPKQCSVLHGRLNIKAHTTMMPLAVVVRRQDPYVGSNQSVSYRPPGLARSSPW